MKAFLLALVLTSPQARADSRDDLKKINSTLSSCMAERDSKNCVSTAIKEADGVLGRIYRAELAKLKRQPDEENAEVLKRLETSQRAWTAFRDANSSLHGITNLEESGMEVLSHRLEMTKDRILELDELLSSDG